MSENSSLGYYQPSKGTLTGFDRVNIPNDNPNIKDTGWSVEQLRRFLENQSDVNFPSNEWIQSIEQMIRDHENDFNNPHRTTLSQIVGDIISQVIGSVVPGTPPDTSPFYVLDAASNLPLGTFLPASYTTNNLYRRTPTGAIVNAQTEDDKVGVDTTGGVIGIPLYSTMTNVTPNNWSSQSSTRLNTTLSVNTDLQVFYPFTFHDVKETPTTAQFGIDIPCTQNLQTAYTTSFYVKAGAVTGFLRIYQPSDMSNYIDVDLTTGETSFFTDTMGGSTVRYADDVIRISVTFTSNSAVVDNKLRVVHLNTGQTGNGTRSGSLGRHIFSVAQPQTTQSTLDQPTMIDLTQTAGCPTLPLNMDVLGLPNQLTSFILTFAVSMRQTPQVTPISDSTILIMGDLVISRNQTQVTVAVDGTIVFTSDILDGLNVFSLSYSPTALAFKDIFNDKQTTTGTYPTIITDDATFGPFGGYLIHAAFYNQVDNTQVLEYLTNA